MKKFVFMACAVFSIISLFAGTFTDKIKERVDDIKNSIPGLSLISNELHYDGLTIKNFQFDTEKKYTIVHPGEEVSAFMDYELKTEDFKNLGLHHFFYGLHPSGPIDCFLHFTGVVNSDGKAEISFKAPKERGIYQLRLCHAKNLLHSDAHEAWFKEENPPNTIIGIVVVE